jgi:hypothetical protein
MRRRYWIHSRALSALAGPARLDHFKSDYAIMESRMTETQTAYGAALAKAASDEERAAVRAEYVRTVMSISRGGLPTWRWR